MRIHKDLTLEHWFTFTLFEQLANVGCDIDRTIKWKNRGKLEDSQCAFERAMELLEATIADPKHRGKGTLKELTRMREALIDYFLCDNEYGSSDELWSN